VQLGQAGVEVVPVVDGGDRPGDGGRLVLQRQALGGAVQHRDDRPQPRRREADGQAAHPDRRVHADRLGAPLGRLAEEPARPATDVDHPVAGAHLGDVGDEARQPSTADRHRQPRDEPERAVELAAAVVRQGSARHRCTPFNRLTVGQYHEMTDGQSSSVLGSGA
jgi:hypothetical protein